MINGKRLSLVAGMAVLTMALAFPGAVAARPHRVVPPDVLGAHTWSGQLCDGTAVSVDYHVTDQGRLVFDAANGAPYRERSFWHRFRVRFTGTGFGVMVWTTWHHGVLRLRSVAWSPTCPPPPPPVDPPTGDPGGVNQPGQYG